MAGINRTTDKATDLITFSRASGGTALRKISYGSELVTNGGFDTDTDWSKGTNATISGGTLSYAGGSGNTDTYQNVTTTSGNVYAVSFTLKNVTAGSAYVRLFGTSSTAETSNGSYTIYYVSVGAGNMWVDVSADFVGEIDNISVKEVLFDQPDGTLTLFNHPTNIPRIEYDVNGNLKGLLVEEARTNLLTYSEQFDNAAWVKSNATVTANAAVAPDGTTTADKVASNTSSNVIVIATESVSVTSGQKYTISFYAKASEKDWVRFGAGNSPFGAGGYTTGRSVYFNLAGGVVGTIGSTFDSASILSVGSGWYLCICVGTAISTTTLNYDISPAHADLDADYSGAGDGIYLWGAQLEAGAFPTSYIPTSGSTVTRAADIASIPTSAFGYNQNAGTVVVEYKSDDNIAYIFALQKDTSNRIFGVSGTVLNCIVNNAGSTVFNTVTSGLTVGSENKCSFSSKLNSAIQVVNGVASSEDTSVALPTVSTLNIGGNGFGEYANGHIKSIQYYPRRLSNAQLQELTS